jgi:hypothetical protein
MAARHSLACLLSPLSCVLLLQGCAAIFGSKGTDVTAVSDTAVVAAEPPRDTATVAQPPGQPFQASAPNEIVSERVKADRRKAVGDILRTGLATTVEQGPPGILRVGVGPRFRTHQARLYYFTQLAFAYDSWSAEGRRLIIELWERGRKIGEYSNQAFAIGPEHTTPINCPDTATTGLCSPLGRPAQEDDAPDMAAPDEAAVPPPAQAMPARKPRERSGLHLGLGLGGGVMDTPCKGCDFASETGFSSFLSVAGSVGVKTLLGVEGTGWTKNQSGATVRVYSLMAQATEYLNPTSGLFLSAGLGVVGYQEETDLGDRTASAVGFSGRLGYEVGAGSVAFAPYVGIVRTFGGADVKLEGENVGLNVAISNLQFGLSIVVP